MEKVGEMRDSGYLYRVHLHAKLRMMYFFLLTTINEIRIEAPQMVGVGADSAERIVNHALSNIEHVDLLSSDQDSERIRLENHPPT